MSPPAQRFTRANTLPGSPERKAVYAREYAERQARANAVGLSYGQARQLRKLYPLTADTKAELKRNGRNSSQMHTRYALIRAQVAVHDKQQGKSLSRVQARAAKVLKPSQYARRNPVGELAGWYKQAYGTHYDAGAFPVSPTAPPTVVEHPSGTQEPTGAGLAGYDWEVQLEPEDLYDIEWSDMDEWDVWDIDMELYG